MQNSTNSLPTKQQLQASAYRLLKEMVAGEGTQPSEEAVAIAASLLGARAWRELNIRLERDHASKEGDV